MRATCILCQNNAPIKNSHIIPRFVVKRLKLGSPLKTLIHSHNLGKVYQDGWKGDFLCSACEGVFSKLEHAFCQTIYDPLLAKQLGKVNYDDSLGLFTASLCFRYIQLALDMNAQKRVPDNLRRVYENLRASLLAGTFAAITSHFYIQFLSPVTKAGEFPPGMNTYLFETIDGKCFDFNVPNKGVFWIVFVKIPEVLFLLSEWDLRLVFKQPSLLDGCELLRSGILHPAAQSSALLQLVKEDFCLRTTEIQENYAKMPAKRVADITAKIAGLADKEQYRAHQSFFLDQQLLAGRNKAES